MHATNRTITLPLLASATIGMCVPGRLPKRNTCTPVGWISRDQSNFEQNPPTFDTTSGFDLYYVGGVEISSSTINQGGSNPIAYGPLTIDQNELHSGESIMWWPYLNVFDYTGCKVSYGALSTRDILTALFIRAWAQKFPSPTAPTVQSTLDVRVICEVDLVELGRS
ncbi:hypothetical protein LTR17_020172 [Elasticomyces elasticus]|nr:hypothetical protein LTR17_020172 [Elasticomyces elasticus]